METCLVESHAAAVKHNVITIEKAMGMIKRYLQLTIVMEPNDRAKAQSLGAARHLLAWIYVLH